MPRPSWDAYFIQAAHHASTRSTCDRLKPLPGVGAVIVQNQAIVATGYSGSPSGVGHCSDLVCNKCEYRQPEDFVLTGTGMIAKATLGQKCPLVYPINCDGVMTAGHKIVRRFNEKGELVAENCVLTVHAEANAIVNAARNGSTTLGGTLYATHLPCWECAKLVINAGLARVIFEVAYKSGDSLGLLFRYVPNGLHQFDKVSSTARRIYKLEEVT